MKERPRERPRTPERRAVPRDWVRGIEWAAAVAFTLVALSLHVVFYQNAGPLWRDEVNSADFAAMPSLPAIYASLQYDSFPMLSTLALRGWSAIGGGSTDGGLRGYGLLVGVLFVGALWAASLILRTRPPWVALALVALNPWIIRSADSIRPYGLGMVAIALTAAAFGKAVSTSSRRWFAAAAVLAILSVQCLYQNAFLVGAMCLAAAVASAKGFQVRRLVGIVIVGAAAALSLLIYIPSLSGAEKWRPLVHGSPGGLELIPNLTGGMFPTWAWAAALGLCLFVGVRSFLARSTQPSTVMGTYLGALVLSGTVIYLVAVRAARVPIQPWYFAPLLAAIAPILDGAVRAAVPFGAPRILAVLAVGLAIGPTTPSAYALVRQRQTNVDEVAAYLKSHADPGDVVIVAPFYLGVTLQRYYRGPAAWTTVPPMPDIRIHRYDGFKTAMTRTDTIVPVIEAMARALPSGKRVWVVGSLRQPNMEQPPPSIPPAPLPQTGWSMVPYEIVWAEQTAYFLALHATQFQAVPKLGGPNVSRYERVGVMVFSGWH